MTNRLLTLLVGLAGLALCAVLGLRALREVPLGVRTPQPSRPQPGDAAATGPGKLEALPAPPLAHGIAGTVSTPSGEPIEGVSIELVVAQEGAETIRASTKSSADGRFDCGRVPPGTYTLRATSAIWGDKVQGPLEVAGDLEVPLVFAGASTIRGKVLMDPKWLPFSRPRDIRVFHVKADGLVAVGKSAVDSTSGDFECGGLCPGAYILRGRADLVDTFDHEVAIARNGDVIQVVLDARASARTVLVFNGRITATRGGVATPLANTRVEVTAKTPDEITVDTSIRTDKEGAFSGPTLEHIMQGTTVRFDLAGYQPVEKTVTYDEVKSGVATWDLVLQGLPGRTVLLQSALGCPLPYCFVTYDDGYRKAHVSTDIDGLVELCNLAPGPHVLRVMVPGLARENLEAWVIVDGTASEDSVGVVTVDVGRSVKIRVRTMDGEPFRDVHGIVQYASNEGEIRRSVNPMVKGQTFTLIAGLPDDAAVFIEVFSRQHGYGSVKVEASSLGCDSVEEISLGGSRMLQFRVVDKAGKPVGDAAYRYEASAFMFRHQRMARMEESRTERFDRIPWGDEGTYLAEVYAGMPCGLEVVSSSGGARMDDPGAAAQGQVVVVSGEGAAAWGRVVDADSGAPLKATVSVLYEDETRENRYTTPGGVFWLPRGDRAPRKIVVSSLGHQDREIEPAGGDQLQEVGLVRK